MERQKQNALVSLKRPIQEFGIVKIETAIDIRLFEPWKKAVFDKAFAERAQASPSQPNPLTPRHFGKRDGDVVDDHATPDAKEIEPQKRQNATEKSA
jgi:hypothetical protein